MEQNVTHTVAPTAVPALSEGATRANIGPTTPIRKVADSGVTSIDVPCTMTVRSGRRATGAQAGKGARVQRA